METNDVIEHLQNKITAQDYSKKPHIDGVKFLELQEFADDGGALAELARLDESGNLPAIPNFKVKQINRSEMSPGAIKAFHLHYVQDDVWFVHSSDKVLVVLADVRKNSPTKGALMRFAFGAGKSRLLFIPRGVAHGVANISSKAATLLYMVNQHFDANNPDERRLPWDTFGKELWELQKG